MVLNTLCVPLPDECSLQGGDPAECVLYSACSPFVQLLINLQVLLRTLRYMDAKARSSFRNQSHRLKKNPRRNVCEPFRGRFHPRFRSS